MKQQIFLTFPQQVLSEPLLYILGRDFRLVPNIKGAMITDQMGMMALEVEGAPEDVEAAVQFLRDRGVKVDRSAPTTG
jgi:hypothetical protein